MSYRIFHKPILNSHALTFILKFIILSCVIEICYLKEIEGGREERKEGGGTERIDVGRLKQRPISVSTDASGVASGRRLICHKDSTC